ncbi:MAG: TRAP transporter large permease subunit [Deltaproteobacteria bacterium]|nr:TRAP transporter large permease subunit [Deltaproteobacteria bacterium]MBW2138662.1 TRAP transporter large permease subunit [Deltaproteobacteria bacterium]
MALSSESLAQGLEEFVGPVSRIANYISMGFLLVMPLPVFFDVLARFIYRGSVPGGIEIESFILLIIVFLGIAFIQFKEGHIRIEFIVSRFPKWVQNALYCFHYLICAMFFAVMSSQLISQGIKKIQDQVVTYDLEIPVWIFWFIASLGLIILTIVVTLDFVRALGQALRDKRPFWLAFALAAACFVLIGPLVGLAPTGLSGATAGILGMGFLFLLLFLGMPIGFGMALTGLLGMIVAYKEVMPSLAMLGIGPFDTASNYMLTVVPLFILMGEFAYHSGISEDLFETANKWLGRLPGGLAMSSVAGCAGFSAVCGDSLATAVTMGTVALPGMKKHNYDMKLATGCLAAGGTMGILIPPSVGFIFYAIVTEESIGKLFVAGIMPGIVLAILFCGVVYIRAKINPALAPRGDVTTLKEKIVSLKGVMGMLALFVLILGGILGGIFSPVEGGAIGSVGAFVYALIRGRVNKTMIIASLQDSLTITCKLLLILIGVGILGYFLAATRLPFALADFVTGLEINRYIIFSAVILFFIILGCLLNVIPMILLVLPTIFPAITALGFDPVWFGVITVLTMEMGQITPPIGVNVFAIGSVARDVPMQDIFRGIFPFFLCMIACAILLVLFPQLALYLPSLLFS